MAEGRKGSTGDGRSPLGSGEKKKESMDIIGMLLIGLIVGALARLVIPGRQPMGILWTLVLGVVGAIIGNKIGEAISSDGTMHWILSVLAAVVLVGVYGAVTGRRSAA